MTRRLRAVLELLRAPLLLSPIADVSAGFALACAGDATWNVTGEASLAWPFSRENLPTDRTTYSPSAIPSLSRTAWTWPAPASGFISMELPNTRTISLRIPIPMR